MPSYSGVWTLPAVMQAIGAQTWPSYVDTSTRAVINLSSTGGTGNTLNYINIAVPSNSAYFGDLLYSGTARNFGCGSSTRGLFAGGTDGSGAVATNIINYITVAANGNATDFGDLTFPRTNGGALSNSTRGVFIVGWQNGANTVNIIDYVTIASTGDAVDFGDALNIQYSIGTNAAASSTRGIFAAGYIPASGVSISTIQYITIASTGNASNFGNLNNSLQLGSACSSSTRALYAAGLQYPDYYTLNVIDYMTIASTGNATDFGDLTVAGYGPAAVSSLTRGVFAGGTGGNNISYVTIATTGNATNFGDLISGGGTTITGCSNCHGGLA